MRPLPRNRRPRPTAPGDPLARLRHRFTLGAAVCATVFAAAFVTDVVRGVQSDNMAVLGVELASAATGVLCGVSAVMAWALPLVAEARQADDVSWAWHLGAEVADAYPSARLNGAAPRTPNIR